MAVNGSGCPHCGAKPNEHCSVTCVNHPTNRNGGNYGKEGKSREEG